MQLPSIASLLNDTSGTERIVLPSVKEMEQINSTSNTFTKHYPSTSSHPSLNNNSSTSNILNTTGSSNSISTGCPQANSVESNNNVQTSSYTCTTTVLSNNKINNVDELPHGSYGIRPGLFSQQEEQHPYINGMWSSSPSMQVGFDVATFDIHPQQHGKYSSTVMRRSTVADLPKNTILKHGIHSPTNSPNSQPIPIFQHKLTSQQEVVQSTLKPIASPHSSRSSPLSFTTATSNSGTSNASNGEIISNSESCNINTNQSQTKKKRKLENCSESSSPTISPSSPFKVLKRTSSGSKKSPSNSSANASFQFMNFSISSDTSKIKFVNSEHQQIGINDGSWTDKEHEDFITGLNECGKGRWREIAEKYVKTRTRTQVASHAQKYFEAQKAQKK